MLEARLLKASVLKRMVDAIKELVNDANFDCDETGITLQAMDSSHVSLVALSLLRETFDAYRCDRAFSLGINVQSMAKILKCAGNDDIVTLTASPDEDKLNFLFEPSGGSNERVSRFSLMLMDIDSEHLGIPDTEYTCEITMPSVEFQRICREVTVLGDTCKIEVNKDRVAFSAQGDMGEGHIVLSVDEAADKKAALKLNVAESVEQSFALRYLNAFTKATPLCDTVKLQLSANVPLVVEYGVPKPTADDGEGKKKKKSEDDEDDDEDIEYTGDLKYFLAPKIEDEE